jgi:hypothetical protein
LLIKQTTAASTTNWILVDAARDTYNAINYSLLPNTSGAETGAGAARLDFLSNGFKIQQTYLDQNASGGTYIYAAFAESPFAYSRAR